MVGGHGMASILFKVGWLFESSSTPILSSVSYINWNGSTFYFENKNMAFLGSKIVKGYMDVV